MVTVTYYTKAGHTIIFECEKINVKHSSDGMITGIETEQQSKYIVIALSDIEAIVF